MTDAATTIDGSHTVSVQA